MNFSNTAAKIAKWSSIAIMAIGLILLFGNISSRFKIPAAINFSKSEQPAGPLPVHLRISAIGVDAPITNLGLNTDNTLQVPKDPDIPGWYEQSPVPGVKGPSVIVGHLDSSKGRPAVFYRLKELKLGDIIEVVRQDGSTVTFEVKEQERIEQDNFPSDKVYGHLDHPGLRLITCSGRFNLIKGHYSHNLIIYADLKE